VKSSGRRGARQGRRILIVGAGDVGAMVARELDRSSSYPVHPIGFVDDDPNKLQARIESLEVLGTTFDLPRIIDEQKVGEVIIAAACGFRTIPNTDSGRSRTPIPVEGEHRFRGSRTVIPGISNGDSGHPER
jgi:hypothetical protein